MQDDQIWHDSNQAAARTSSVLKWKRIVISILQGVWKTLQDKLRVSFLDMHKRESMDLKVNQAYQIHEKSCLGDYTISASVVLCIAASRFLMCPPTLLCVNGTCRIARCARKTGLAALLLV